MLAEPAFVIFEAPMGIAQLGNNHHWNHFLMLDADTAQISRYIEFAPANYQTYSLELARLLMSAAAEVDVVAKIACARVAPTSRCERIGDYYQVLSAHRKGLKTYPIRIGRFGLELEPWTSWTARRSPLWWTAHNQVKHRRDQSFPAANLKNALNAVGGLFVMLLYAFPDEAQQGTLMPRPALFSVPETHVAGYGAIEHGSPVSYRI